jgi:Lon-like protease
LRRLLLVLLLVAAGTVVARGQVPCDVLAAQPACYVALLPGPTEDTVALTTIGGAETYESAGELRLTTVAVDSDLDLFEYVRDLFSRQTQTVARHVLYPEGESDEDVSARNRILMQNSQLDATIAGLVAAGYDLDGLPDGAEVLEVQAGGAVDAGQVETGDVIVAVDGVAIGSADDAVAAVQLRRPGDEIQLTLRRGGTEHTVTLTAGAHPDDPERPLLGLLLADYLELPVDVAIDAGNIGGPSAGLMFALGIVDLLGPEDLTAGKVIAGTGTIDRSGTVGGIGGIQQKVIGATRGDSPATVFLTPRDNFTEARGAAVDTEILLVPVGTLDEALTALQALARGQEPVGAFALGG